MCIMYMTLCVRACVYAYLGARMCMLPMQYIISQLLLVYTREEIEGIDDLTNLFHTA